MSTLLIVEHDNHVMKPSTHHVLTAALQLEANVTLLVVGYQCRLVAEQASRLNGVHAVLHVDHPCYTHLLAENLGALVVSLSDTFSAIVCASTPVGKNILPRIAALLDVAQVSDVTCIINNKTFEHPIYAGNAIETVELLDDKKLLSIRTTAFSPVIAEQAACRIESIERPFASPNIRFINQVLSTSTRPELSNARIIVSGGRGLQHAENFKLIEQLADKLGAAVGASRAAVDAGFVSNDCQVGQTGKIVAPTLYIAVGISGAIQHVAGMRESTVIVAINKDEDAPIFEIATYGLVGDLFTLVPELIERLGEIK